MPISTFIDRKVFQYSINLLQSRYAKTQTEEVFDYLNSLLGEEEVAQTIKLQFGQESFPRHEKLMELYGTECPPGFSDFKKILSMSELVQFLEVSILPILQHHHKEYDQKTLTDKRLDELKNLFHLTSTDLEIISFKYVAEQSSIFGDAFEHTIANLSNKTSFLSNGSTILNISKSQIMNALRRGNLVTCQLLDLDESFILADWIEDYLSGLDDDPNKIFFSKVTDEALPIDVHHIKQSELNVLNQYLENPEGKNILFYGEPGTGKTELAKSLAHHRQTELYIINNKDENNENCKAMKTSIIAACNILDSQTSIILVDEADELLNTQFSFLVSGEKNNKSWINRFLDHSKHKIIWITNRSTQIESSTMRRFSFSMHFKRFTVKKKLQVFDYCLKKRKLEGFFTTDEIQSFCRRYSINAGGIADALHNLRIRKNSNKAKVIENLNTLFKNHEMAITGQEHKGNRMKEMGAYNVKALHASESLENVITSVEKFLNRQTTLDNGKRINFNILLYGIPGSGKTEFVKYLGKTLQKEIVLKRSSDLLSCWVGETEKLIAKAFDEAEGEQSILFLDEADSFLSPREDASRSWEKTQVNELLTQMENFNGVLICATNLLKGLDQAALRRFKFKIEFLPLTAEGNLEMYQTVLLPFINKRTLSPTLEKKIRSLKKLTPGDFHVVAEKFSLMDTKPTHQQIIQSLEDEIKFKPSDSRIGFGN